MTVKIWSQKNLLFLRYRPCHLFLAAIVSLATLALYLPTLQNEFVNWDDVEYITGNPHLRSFDLIFLKWAFFDFYAANWHPLTWISHALDYAVWGLNPMGHHLTNNILHAVNTFLVVLLVVRLIEATSLLNSPYPPLRLRGGAEGGGVTPDTTHDSRFKLITAGVTGLLFGLHPIHVESVAWVSERKDLLCAMFYLLSVMAYLKYTDRITPPSPSLTKEGVPERAGALAKRGWRSRGRYIFALTFFILALMSKPMAVSLPFVLLILDWYPFGKITSCKTFRTHVAGKIPFFALSLLSSILTILAQASGKTIQSAESYPLLPRVFVAAKALFAYLWKMIYPLHLVPFYPYPEDLQTSSLVYYSFIVLGLLITAACIITARKQKLLTAVWFFYLVTLAPVLGIVQVGGQSMADRYAYLPGIGPFLLMGFGAAWLYGRVDAAKIKLLPYGLFGALLAIVVLVAMSYLSIKQMHLWKNSVELWSYVIEKYPGKVRRAYINRSAAFCETGQYDRALADYDMAIAVAPLDPDVYYGNGLVLSEIGQFDKAVVKYNIAIALSEDGEESFFGRELFYLNRGLAHIRTGQYELGISDLKKACSLGSNDGCRHLKNYVDGKEQTK